MTLLITVFAAIVSTIVWYTNKQRRQYRLSILSLMYWGASLMWLGDAIMEYIELGATYFTQDTTDMINDAFLGSCVVALGLIIWLVILLIHDPQGILRKSASKTSE